VGTGQAKMQWVQDPKQRNAVNLNNIKREVSRHLRNKGRNISKLKLMNLKLTLRSHTHTHTHIYIYI
jgi:hypothetical protein